MGAGFSVSDVSASALMVVFISAATLKTGIIREGTAADTFIHMEASASQLCTNMHIYGCIYVLMCLWALQDCKCC